MARHRLEEVLLEKGWSKRKFARRLKKDYPTTFRWYRPGYDPKLSTLALWAKTLRVKIRDLIDEK